jgi:hypothetical protein
VCSVENARQLAKNRDYAQNPSMSEMAWLRKLSRALSQPCFSVWIISGFPVIRPQLAS